MKKVNDAVMGQSKKWRQEEAATAAASLVFNLLWVKYVLNISLEFLRKAVVFYGRACSIRSCKIFYDKILLGFWKKIRPFWGSAENLFLLYRKLLLIWDATIISNNIVILLLRICEPSGSLYITTRFPCYIRQFLPNVNMRITIKFPCSRKMYRLSKTKFFVCGNSFLSTNNRPLNFFLDYK